MIHVLSFAAMEADEEVFSQKAITLLCPFAVSPQLMNESGYFEERGAVQSVWVDGHHRWIAVFPLPDE